MWQLEDGLSVQCELLDWWDLPLGDLERLEMEYAMHWAGKGYRQGRTLTRTATMLPFGKAA